MGLFDKLKNIITKKEVEEKKDDTIKKYDEGLEKSRNEFVSKLSMLGIKYTKINDEYFDELENILIMADILAGQWTRLIKKLKQPIEYPRNQYITFSWLSLLLVRETTPKLMICL